MKTRKLPIIIAVIIILAVFFGTYNFLKITRLKYVHKSDGYNSKTISQIKSSQPQKIVGNRDFSGDIIYNNSSIPVLMYHSIDYEKGNELRIPKDIFKEQMEYLKDNGYVTLTLDEAYEFFNNNKPVPRKSVLITFDDGYEDNYVNAYPILKQFGFNATIFIISSTVDKDRGYVTSSQLKEMSENGIDIEGHTSKHEKLDQLSYEQQFQTLKNSKDFLERILKKNVEYMAYPYGQWNANSLKAAQAAGYKMSFTTNSGWANKSQGLYKLNRVYISANHNIEEFKRRLTNPNYDTSN